jgi:serine protease Do
MKLGRYIRPIVILILILGFILSSGCDKEAQIKVVSPVPAAEAAVNTVYPDFVSLAQKVGKSVVAVTAQDIPMNDLNSNTVVESLGSGWVIDESGIIVTNNHVVEGAEAITVEFSDHKAFDANTWYTDPITDVAVVKVNTQGKKLTALTIGDTSQLQIGSWVMIMGNPLGLGLSVKQGIISRLGVTMSTSPDQIYYNLIETSAPINPGNSGGAMVNLNGEVIGITSLKIESAGIEGMGYAIPIGDVLPIIQTLTDGKKVIHPTLGASLTSVDSGIKSVYKLNVDTGALVTDVSKNSPAAKAGITKGDVIVGFEDKPVVTADDLNHFINLSQIGQRVQLVLWHGKSQQTVEVTLTEQLRISAPTPSPT